MSDNERSIASVPVPVDPAADRESQIRDIATDTSMSVAERQARLQALAADWDLPQSNDGEPIEDPLMLQISSALTMLAEGGHR